ncbi:MAG: hypothetical protein WCK35_28450 [Chloroflexota bacterium]
MNERDEMEDFDSGDADDDDDLQEPGAPDQQDKPQIDMEMLAQKVFERFLRELLLENERIGR